MSARNYTRETPNNLGNAPRLFRFDYEMPSPRSFHAGSIDLVIGKRKSLDAHLPSLLGKIGKHMVECTFYPFPRLPTEIHL